MLPKKNRISQAGFPKNLSRARNFGFGMLRTASAGRLSVAVVAPKKVFRTAVERNRARRRSYSALKNILRTDPIFKVVIIYPHHSLLKAPLDEIEYGMRAALRAR